MTDTTDKRCGTCAHWIQVSSDYGTCKRDGLFMGAAGTCNGWNPRGATALTQGPSHYTDMGYQPVEAIRALLTREEYIGWLKGSIINMAMRQGRKEGTDDAAKARHYEQWLGEVDG